MPGDSGQRGHMRNLEALQHNASGQSRFQVEDLVERDIDGILFPAKVVAVREASVGASEAGTRAAACRLSYDLVYLDDNNRECEVPREDIRPAQDADKISGILGKDRNGASGAGEGGGKDQPARVGAGRMERGEVGESLEAKTADRVESIQKNCNKKRGQKLGDDDYGETEAQPKVIIHSSNATFDKKEDGSATAYIINGPETNVAAGSGLRGIRWLRG